MNDAAHRSAIVVRDACDADLAAIAALVAELGYPIGIDDARERLARVRGAGDRALVAESAAGVVGVATLHVKHVLHRASPVGVLTALVVDERARGSGIGASLVEAAEREFAALGCGVVEVSSNRARERAHAFYARHGYAATSLGFRKALA